MTNQQPNQSQKDQNGTRENRKIVERIVITGKLRLLTPTHLGSGEAADITDMTLIRDEVTGKPLLTGTTIAGALRNYLRERLYGYHGKPPKQSTLTLLFGGERGDDEGKQSLLIVDDALAEKAQVEIRDGVAINPATGTAEEGKKYDLELLAAGTTFPLRFELLIPKGVGSEEKGDEPQDEELELELKKALALALQGLEEEEITLGARKRRGFGRCKVEKWEVISYDLTKPDGLIAWLEAEDDPPDGESAQEKPQSEPQQSIAAWLHVKDKVEAEAKKDQRCRFTLNATFRLEGPLLIRSAEKGAELGADFAHLHSWRVGESDGVDEGHRVGEGTALGHPEDGTRTPPAHGVGEGTALNDPRGRKAVPVLPGTSVAGVLRHRALRILNTLSNGQGKALVCELFGGGEEDCAEIKASRLIVEETVIRETATFVQPRIRIDRFTGGVYPGALFSEAPLVSKSKGTPQRETPQADERQVQIRLELRTPRMWEIGLLLLLLKDLWTGDLPLGGERSIGRGRLQGLKASMEYCCRGAFWTCSIRRQGKGNELSLESCEGCEGCKNGPIKGAMEKLETYLLALHREIKRRKEARDGK